MSQDLAQLVDDLHVQSALGNKARMVDLCGRITALEPEQPDALITVALLAWRHGKRDEAELLLHRAAERHPNHPECLASLADIMSARGKFQDAIDFYKRSIALRPDDPNTLLRAARVMLRVDDAPTAIDLLSQGLGRNAAATTGPWSDVWRELAALYLHENRGGEALAALATVMGGDVPGAAQAETFDQGGDLLAYCQARGLKALVMDDLAMTRMTDPDGADARPAFVCGLESVRLLGTSFVPVTEDGKFFAEGLVPNPEKIVSPLAGFYTDVVQVSDGRRILAAAENEQAIDGEYFFVGFHENFGHWILNIFSRLMIAARSPRLRGLPLVLGHGVGAMHFECLARAGYSADRVLIVEPNTIYRFEKLWMPSMLYHGYRGELYWAPRIVDYVRGTLMSAAPAGPSPGKRYYLTRRAARWRRLVNEDALLDLVAARGFEVINPADYTIAEQTKMAAEAEAIMGPIGAGMMLLLFASPGAKIIELTYDFPAMDVHPTISAYLGLDYHRIMGEAVNQGDDPLNHDFAVALNEVERRLSALLDG